MKKLKLRPLQDRVVVRKQEEPGITKGGIVLPETSKDRPTKGTVLAVGDGVLKDGMTVPVEVRVGDVVVFTKYAGLEIEHEGETLLVLRESDIAAVIG